MPDQRRRVRRVTTPRENRDRVPGGRGAAAARLVALGAGRIDAMVLQHNDLGQTIWRAAGYRRQDEWRRWVREQAPTAGPR
ncbi:hypothetical protein [Nocardioides nitrophenolicus]|uniref:hypothetical protein n=1 Tax=Nocardioides nitrophenolicus TaxID=60489 RepID=UPI0019614E40|nr:hypothetical protein [Nocardioides nitrophenolicus]MBM7518404.1 hypothetical protein [Nocardioides nitrophenolicus]